MPSLRLIAGPNGSGKTTLTELLRVEHSLPLGQYLNPDDIAKHIKQSEVFVEDDNTAEKLAQSVGIGLRSDWMRDGLSFTYESVMSHESHMDFVKVALENNYKPYLYYVCVSNTDLNKQRVLQRVEGGGHDVPEDKIESRHKRSLENLYEMLTICRRGYLFDNSTSKMVFLAEVTKDGYLDISFKAYEETQPYWFQKAVVEKWEKSQIRFIKE